MPIHGCVILVRRRQPEAYEHAQCVRVERQRFPAPRPQQESIGGRSADARKSLEDLPRPILLLVERPIEIAPMLIDNRPRRIAKLVGASCGEPPGRSDDLLQPRRRRRKNRSRIGPHLAGEPAKRLLTFRVGREIRHVEVENREPGIARGWRQRRAIVATQTGDQTIEVYQRKSRVTFTAKLRFTIDGNPRPSVSRPSL